MMAILREYLDRIWDYQSGYPWERFTKNLKIDQQKVIEEMQAEINEIFKESDLSREGVADVINNKAGEKVVTKALFDKYTRSTGERVKFPLELVIIFTLVTRNFKLIQWILDYFGLKCINPEEAKLFELFKAQRMAGELSSQVAALESQIEDK